MRYGNNRGFVLIAILLLCLLLVGVASAASIDLYPESDRNMFNITTQTAFLDLMNTPNATGNTTPTTRTSAYLGAGSTSNQFTQVNRGIIGKFNFTQLNGSCIVDSWTLHLWGDSNTSGLGSTPVVFVVWTPDNQTVYETKSFSRSHYGTTPLTANITPATFSTTQWMNLTGLDNGFVVVGGYNFIGERLGWDIDNSFGGTWINGATVAYFFKAIENASNKPFITIVYHLATGGGIPLSITNLAAQNITSSQINWTWQNGDPNITYIQVWKDNVYLHNISYPTNYDLWSGLTASQSYTISTRTFNDSAYMNTTWGNSSASTNGTSSSVIPGFTYTAPTSYDTLIASWPPAGVTQQDLGPSFNSSQHLYGWCVGACDGSKPYIYYDAGIHGMSEYQGTISLIKWMTYLGNPSSLPSNVQTNITALEAKYDFYAIPVVNPSSFYTPYRNNLSCNDTQPGRYNQHCVDINRNFPRCWTGYTGNYPYETTTSMGAYPLSEPETQIVYNKLNQLKPVLTVNNHWGDYTVMSGETHVSQIVGLAKNVSALLTGGSFVFDTSEATPWSGLWPMETIYASRLVSSTGNLTIATTLEEGNTSQTQTQETSMAMTWMYLLPYYYDQNYFDPLTPPVASFTANVTSGTAPLAVQFTDTTSNSPTSWGWFYQNVTPGNNTVVQFDTAQNPVKIFGVGNYTIHLNATNTYGSNVTPNNYWINVSAYTPPVALPAVAFSANNLSFCLHNSTQFTDASVTTITNWAWAFGDGNTSALTNPSHVYDFVGVFDVSLQVTNASGTNSLTKSGYITVLACGNATPPVNAPGYTNGLPNAVPLPIVLFVALIGIILVSLGIFLAPERGGDICAILAPFPLLISSWQFLFVDVIATGSDITHTIYAMYPEAAIMIVIFAISLLNVYRVIMLTRNKNSDEDDE